MIKKTITYKDYNGNTRTEDFYFHLSKAELTEMELEVEGGMTQMLTRIIDAQEVSEIVKMFKVILFRAYGEKSPDGRRLIKSKELSEAFSQMPVYSDLFMELSTDANKASDFIKGIIPSDLSTETIEDENITPV